MNTPEVKDALEKVFKTMKAMSPEQLRAELDAHRNGPMAVAFRDTQEFKDDAGPDDAPPSATPT